VHGNATDVMVKDADSLLAELDPPPLAIDQAAEDEPPPPKMPTRSPSSDLHSIPLEVSPEKLDGGTSFEDSDLESELQEDPPSSFQAK